MTTALQGPHRRGQPTVSCSSCRTGSPSGGRGRSASALRPRPSGTGLTTWQSPRWGSLETRCSTGESSETRCSTSESSWPGVLQVSHQRPGVIQVSHQRPGVLQVRLESHTELYWCWNMTLLGVSSKFDIANTICQVIHIWPQMRWRVKSEINVLLSSYILTLMSNKSNWMLYVLLYLVSHSLSSFLAHCTALCLHHSPVYLETCESLWWVDVIRSSIRSAYCVMLYWLGLHIVWCCID